MRNNTVRDVVQALESQVMSVVKYLLPNGVLKGSEYEVGSVNGEQGDSLKICVQGSKLGAWCDFAGNGVSGDLLDLWAQTRGLALPEAMKEARAFVGMVRPSLEVKQQKAFTKPPKEGLQPITDGVMEYLQARGLSRETIEAYKIVAEHSNDKEWIVFPFLVGGELVCTKSLGVVRIDGKKDIKVSKGSQPCLFGWQAVPPLATKLVITEGEIDAMSLWQILGGSERADYGVVSVPFGAGNHQWVEHEFDRLEVFDEIYLCFDNDDAGVAGRTELLKRLGRHRCKVVMLPMKDANECLLAGIDVVASLLVAKTMDPEQLKNPVDFADKAWRLFNPVTVEEEGYTMPWPATHEKLRLRKNELSLWTGINGHGKSQMLGQIVLDCVEQGARALVASFELKPERMLHRMIRQAGTTSDPAEEYFHEIIDWMQGKIFVFDVVGTTKTSDVLEVFLYARQRYGINMFVIDSLMKCGIAEDDYNSQKLFVDQLCQFKNEHDVHVHLVAHPRKNEGEDKVPGKMDIKGTGAISDLADNCFCVWRNKGKEAKLAKENPSQELIEKYDCVLSCDKQRNGEHEGQFYLWFDKESFQYVPSYNERPRRFVPT